MHSWTERQIITPSLSSSLVSHSRGLMHTMSTLMQLPIREENIVNFLKNSRPWTSTVVYVLLSFILFPFSFYYNKFLIKL